MICICELSFDDGGHVPFNAGLLATVSSAYPIEKLFFYGASTHIEELRKELTPLLANSVAWTEIRPPRPGTPYVRRFVRELRIILGVVKNVSRQRGSRLLFASAYPSTVLALKVARFFVSTQISVQVILHGMSGVIGKRYRHPVRRFQDMRSALGFLSNTNIQYLVLEESIRDTVRQRLPFLSRRVEALEHPIAPAEVSNEAIELTKPIRFGFLGLADKPKGFPVFLKLANDILAKYGRGAEFHVVGRFPENTVHTNGTEALATKPGTKLMSRSKFIEGLRPLHFIVLPHEAGTYTLTASGVVLDAITWQKPIIARKIPIFETMFEKYGDIGYLFHNDNELEGIVEGILTATDMLRYQRQVTNLQMVRKARAPESLSTVYRELCEKIASA